MITETRISGANPDSHIKCSKPSRILKLSAMSQFKCKAKPLKLLKCESHDQVQCDMIVDWLFLHPEGALGIFPG